MDFTRQPVLETIITPREGFKLVVRSSKGNSQEEYFVEAVEIVTFGSATFLRSLEKPKCFLLPVTDYEVLEVREMRMVLKHTGTVKSIKIGTTKEATKIVKPQLKEELSEEKEPADAKQDKKRERRRKSRRRSRSDVSTEDSNPLNDDMDDFGDQNIAEIQSAEAEPQVKEKNARLFPAPSTLIRDTIARYRESDSFKDAFYLEEEKQKQQALLAEQLQQPEAQEQALQEQIADLHLPALSDADEGFPVEPYHEHQSLWDFTDSESVETHKE